MPESPHTVEEVVKAHAVHDPRLQGMTIDEVCALALKALSLESQLKSARADAACKMRRIRDEEQFEAAQKAIRRLVKKGRLLKETRRAKQQSERQQDDAP